MVRVHLGQPIPDVVFWLVRRRSSGDVAQLVEHLVCNQGVVGSSPIVSTIFASGRAVSGRGEPNCPCIACALRGLKFFDKLGWWNEIVEDLE